MIKKLYKYDLKKATKILKWFYVISLSLAIVTRLINIGKDIQVIKIIGMVFAGCTYSAVANVLINTFIHVLKAFSDGFYKDESYLTHTLPVSKKQLLISKYLTAITVILSSFIVIVASLFAVLYDKALIEGVKLYIQTSISGLNISAGLFISVILVILLAEFFTLTFMGFTAIVKCNTYNNGRAFKGVLWFIAYYLGSMALLFVAVIITFAISGNLAEITASVMKGSSLLTIIIVGAVLYLLITVYYGFLCYKLFKKGVNVD